MTSTRRNTLKTPFRVPKLLGSGHFSLVPGLNYSKIFNISLSSKFAGNITFLDLSLYLDPLYCLYSNHIKNIAGIYTLQFFHADRAAPSGRLLFPTSFVFGACLAECLAKENVSAIISALSCLAECWQGRMFLQ